MKNIELISIKSIRDREFVFEFKNNIPENVILRPNNDYDRLKIKNMIISDFNNLRRNPVFDYFDVNELINYMLTYKH